MTIKNALIEKEIMIYLAPFLKFKIRWRTKIKMVNNSGIVAGKSLILSKKFPFINSKKDL